MTSWGTSWLPKFNFCSICLVTIDKFDEQDDVEASCVVNFGDDGHDETVPSEDLLDLNLWGWDFLALKYRDSLLKSYSVKKHAKNLYY